MTRKDYELVANSIKQVALSVSGSAAKVRTAELIAVNLCIGLKKDNPRFDKERFLLACGFPSPWLEDE